MDQGAAAVIAACIAAIAAAGTYVASEIIKSRRSSADRRAAAFAKLTVALEAVVRAELRPRIARPWNRTDVAVTFASNYIVAVLSQREMVLWDWLGYNVSALAEASDPEERAHRAADIGAVVTQWQRDRRKARAYVIRELDALASDPKALPSF